MVEKPTLTTISRLSGLAVPKVSRVLHDGPDIGAATKKLVRRIADEIGDVPNRARAAAGVRAAGTMLRVLQGASSDSPNAEV